MAKALDDYIYCSPFLNVASLDRLLDRPDENGRPFEVRDSRPLPDEQVERQRACDAIHGAVDELPPRQREVIRAIYFGEDTVTQTAQQLHISAAAVVKLRTKGLKHLVTMLAPQRQALFA
jgi:RNA polymerase sigma factor (sigma-70 family)